MLLLLDHHGQPEKVKLSWSFIVFSYDFSRGKWGVHAQSRFPSQARLSCGCPYNGHGPQAVAVKHMPQDISMDPHHLVATKGRTWTVIRKGC